MGPPALTPEYVTANSTGALVPKMSLVTALATLLAAFRIGLRLRRKRVGIDDWLIIVSVVCDTLCSVQTSHNMLIVRRFYGHFTLCACLPSNTAG
jgi:hypothetical protein